MAAFMRCARCFKNIDKTTNLTAYRVYLNYCTSQALEQTVNLPVEVDVDRHYPPIKPKYPPGNWNGFDPKVAWFWEEERQQVSSHLNANAKLKFLTKKAFKTWKFPAINLAPKALNYQCGIAKTYMLHELPKLYETVDVIDDFEAVKTVLIESLEMEHDMDRSKAKNRFDNVASFSTSVPTRRWTYEESRLKFESLMNNLLGMLIKHRHVSDCLIDRDVTVAACFQRDGVQRGKTFVKPKDINYISQNNSMYQGEHVVDMQIRKRKPLPEFAALEDQLCLGEYPSDHYDYSPKYLGQFQEHLQRKITSGFNMTSPQDPYPFTHLSVVFSNHEKVDYMYQKYGEECGKQAVEGYGLVTSFLSTLAQAHMQGFNMYEELTYPFTTQTIITDGQEFRMSAYQLNTTQLFKPDCDNNSRNCYWLSSPQKLYQEFADGKIVGFNDDVLKTLLKFLLVKPCDRNGVNLHPNIEDDETSTVVPRKKIEVIIEEAVEYDK